MTPVGGSGFTGPDFVGPVGFPGGASSAGTVTAVGDALQHMRVVELDSGYHASAKTITLQPQIVTVRSVHTSPVAHLGSAAEIFVFLVALVVVLGRAVRLAAARLVLG